MTPPKRVATHLERRCSPVQRCSVVTSRPVTRPVDTTIPEPKPATISRELGYPSDYIPEDMRVCAEEVGSDRRICDARFTSREDRRLYTLKVPASSYRVYAQTRDQPDYKAYYTEAVVSGLSVDCRSHEPITLDLRAGGTRAKVNPQDWYATATAK